jgi:hypothetical protein
VGQASRLTREYLELPSLRSSIRKRLEAEEAEKDNPAKEAESNPVEQADNPDNPVEQAAQEAIQTKLDEQPEPVVEPRMQAEEDDTEDFTDEVNQLNLRLADAQAQVAGHKFGSREYVDAIANNLRREDSPRRERGSPPPMAPVSRSTPSWSSGRTTPSKTEVTAEEAAFARSVGVDLEEYRRNKAKMLQMKASGVIQE